MEQFNWHIRAGMVSFGILMLLLMILVGSAIAKNIAVVVCLANAASLESGSRLCGIALTVFTLEEQIGGTDDGD